MIEIILTLGGSIRWCASSPIEVDDSITAAMVKDLNIPIYAWKEVTDRDFWWCIEKCCMVEWWRPDILIDTGSKMTSYLSKYRPDVLNQLVGIVENTKAGFEKLLALQNKSELITKCHSLYTTVTKSIVRNQLEKESIRHLTILR